MEHAHQGGPEGLIARFAIDGGSQVAQRPVQVHRLSGGSALTLVVVGEGKNDVGLRRLLGPQFLQNLLGLPPLTGRLDGPRQAGFGSRACRIHCPRVEPALRASAAASWALPWRLVTDARRSKDFQIRGRKLHHPPERSFGAAKVSKMYVVERGELRKRPNLLFGAALQARDTNQRFGGALPILGSAVGVDQLLERGEVERIELESTRAMRWLTPSRSPSLTTLTRLLRRADQPAWAYRRRHRCGHR